MNRDDKAEAWKQTESTFAAYAAQRHVPLRGTFELTPRCNFNCKMCYIHMSPADVVGCGKQELSTAEWLRIAQDAIENGTLHLMLTGGEPLLRDDFAEIYTEISKMGFIIGLNTNASLMNDKYYKLFSKYPPSSVSVTMYGSDRETYYNITGNSDNFEKTIRGLEYLSDLPTELDIKATFIKDNKDQLDSIREIANRFTKRFAINFMVFKPIPGVRSQAEQCRLSAKECIDIDISNSLYYNKLRKEQRAEKKFADTPVESVSKKKDYGMDIYPDVLTCLSAKCAYWITWDGKMLPCGTFNEIYTLPLEEGFKEAWDRLPSLFKDISHPKECLQCKYYNYCPNCPAYFKVETGSYDKVSEYICKLAHERNERYASEWKKHRI